MKLIRCSLLIVRLLVVLCGLEVAFDNETGSNAVAETPRRVHYRKQSPERAKIESALAQPVTDEHAVPGTLREIAERLEQTFEIPVMLDEASLSAEGVNPDKGTVTLLAGISIQNALELVLSDFFGVQVCWQIRRNVLEITTRTKADETLETVVYELRGLRQSLRDHPEVVRHLVRTGTSGAWTDEHFGAEEIQPFTGGLMVIQTARVHREITSLIERLTLLQDAEPAPVHPPVPQPARLRGVRKSATEQRIELAMQQPAPASLAKAGTLQELADALSRDLEIPVFLDEEQIAREGVAANTEIRLPPLSIPANDFISRALEDVNGVPLTWMISGDNLRITTQTAAEEDWETRIYDLNGLPLELAADPYQVMNMIHAHFHRYWYESCPGASNEFDGGILLRTLPVLHAETDELFRQLREFANQEGYPEARRYEEPPRPTYNPGPNAPFPPPVRQVPPTTIPEGQPKCVLPRRSCPPAYCCRSLSCRRTCRPSRNPRRGTSRASCTTAGIRKSAAELKPPSIRG